MRSFAFKGVQKYKIFVDVIKEKNFMFIKLQATCQ